MTKYNLILKGCVFYLIFTVLTVNAYAAPVQFSDNFNDGIIDSTFWNVSGDGISESGGTLNISRNNAIDSLSSIASFSGFLNISFDITLESMVWNDMFHGISLMESPIGGTQFSNGVSFGFSQYGKFYSARSTTDSVSYDYAGSFSTDSKYSFNLINDASDIYLSINDSLMFTQKFSSNRNYFIHFPGLYEDGDNGGSIGITSSRIDDFSLTATPVPLPSTVLLFGSALLLSLGLKKHSARIND